MTKFSKIFLPSLLSLSLCSINFASSPEIEKFKHSWLSQALKLQREIDINEPLSKATFLATHNSYNSRAYQIPMARYMDPNQTLSLYDQLEAGVRSIELDAHWTLSNHFSKEILLCHGKNNHFGCSVFDRKFTEGLMEIRRWLIENPKEIVLLYIERHLNGHEPRLASQLELTVGEFIFKPEQVRDSKAEANSCVTLPTTISKADILKSGKRLVIVTKGCDGTNPHYQEQNKYPQVWNNYVFAGIADLRGASYTFLEELAKDFPGLPNCDKEDAFGIDPTHSSIWRVYEDRTIYGNLPIENKKLDEYVMYEMVRCGINWQTMDMLKVNDERLAAAVWSWAQGYPKEGAGNCAVYQNSNGFVNVSCNSAVSAVACINSVTQEVKALAKPATFNDGHQLCATLGNDWRFAVPVNGLQMANLENSVEETKVPEVALNYKYTTKGMWEPNL